MFAHSPKQKGLGRAAQSRWNGCGHSCTWAVVTEPDGQIGLVHNPVGAKNGDLSCFAGKVHLQDATSTKISWCSRGKALDCMTAHDIALKTAKGGHSWVQVAAWLHRMPDQLSGLQHKWSSKTSKPVPRTLQVYLVVQTQGQAIALAPLAAEGRIALSCGALLHQSDLAGHTQPWQGADVPEAQCRQMAALVCGPLVGWDVYAHIPMGLVVLHLWMRACCCWLTAS